VRLCSQDAVAIVSRTTFAWQRIVSSPLMPSRCMLLTKPSRSRDAVTPVIVVAHIRHQRGALTQLVRLLEGASSKVLSVAVGPCDRADVWRATVSLKNPCDPALLEKFCQVASILDFGCLSSESTIAREATMVRVTLARGMLMPFAQFASAHGAKLPYASITCAVAELLETRVCIDAFIQRAQLYGTCEVLRTGPLAMSIL